MLACMAVGDLYAMGPLCSICRQIEIPLVARIAVTLAGRFLVALPSNRVSAGLS